MEKNQNDKPRERSVGAIWIREGKNDSKWLNIKIELVEGEAINLIGFKNRKKQPGDKFPDYRIYHHLKKSNAPTTQKTSSSKQEEAKEEEITL